MRDREGREVTYSGLRGNGAASRPGIAVLLATAAVLTIISHSPADAQQTVKVARAATRSFNIPAQSLAPALTMFGDQADMQVTADTALLEGLQGQPVVGDFGTLEALSRLLSGTGLSWRSIGPRSVALVRAPHAADGAIQLGPVKVQGDNGAQGYAPPRTDLAATDGLRGYAASAATVAGKGAQSLRDIPQSVSVITRQLMNDHNMVSLEDALRQTTGVTSVPYGDGSAYFQTRGYGSEVQFDGIPANNGLQYLSQFDLGMYDRVEVLRGPAGLLQGSGSPAGTVNLVRKRPHDSFGWAGSLMGGSWNNLHADLDVTGPLNASGTIRARGVISGQDRDFFFDKAHEKHVLVYGIVEADLDPDTTLTLSGAFEDQTVGPFDYGQSTYSNGKILGASRSAFFGVPWAKGPTHSREAYASLDHRFGGDWAAKVSVDYRRQRLTGKYGYIDGFVDPADNTADYALQSQYVLNEWLGVDANVSGSVTLFGRAHSLLFGANYAWRNNADHSGYTGLSGVDVFNINIPEQDIPFDSGGNTRTEQFGLYGQGRFSLADPLTLVLGGRITDYRSKSRSGYPVLGDFTKDPNVTGKFTPYAGLVYDVTSSFTLYGSYVDIFIPQTNRTFTETSLKPRTGRQVELGAKAALLDGRLNATLAAFDIRDRNRAYEDPEHPTYYIAVGKVRSRGVEAEVSGEPLPGWNLLAGYTYLRTKFLKDTNNEGALFDSEEPRHTFKLWNTYRFQPLDMPGFQIGGGIRVMSKTTRGGPYQPAYAVVDGQIGYRIDRDWSVTATVNNLFDKRYFARVPFYYFGIYGEPRSVTVALRKNF